MLQYSADTTTSEKKIYTTLDKTNVSLAEKIEAMPVNITLNPKENIEISKYATE